MTDREAKINKINEVLGERLAHIILLLDFDGIEKDKLNYSACLNNDERINYTKSELKKCQVEILQCDASLAPYVKSIIYDYDMNIDIRLPIICTNYIATYLEDIAESLADDYESVEAIENDDFLNNDFDFEGEEFAYEQAFIFIKHFFYMGYRIFSLKSLIEDVEQTKNENKKEDTETKINSMNLENKNLEIFKKSLKYNYPVEHAPISFVKTWEQNFFYLKKEVLNNLIFLHTEGKKPYIRSLINELDELLKNCQTTKEQLEEIYLKYDTNESSIFFLELESNPLHNAIYNVPPTFEETLKDDFNIDTEYLQYMFYNYHYGKTIRDAIDFLNEQGIEYKVDSKPQVNKNSLYKIVNKEYTFFRSQLQSNFMFRDESLFVYDALKTKSNSVKSEIFENLLYIDNQINKKAYLEKIIFELNIHLEDFKQTKESFEKFIAHYNSDLDKILAKRDTNDVVMQWLMEPLPIESECLKPGFNYDIVIIHDYFRNYSKGHFIKDLLNFVQKQLGEDKTEKPSNDNIIPPIVNQIKDIEKTKKIILNEQNFEDLLTPTNAVFVLKMLDDLSITVNGKSVLSVRKKGAIRGISEALIDSNILPQISLEISCKMIANKIGLELNSKLDYSNISEEFNKKANLYISKNYK